MTSTKRLNIITVKNIRGQGAGNRQERRREGKGREGEIKEGKEEAKDRVQYTEWPRAQSR